VSLGSTTQEVEPVRLLLWLGCLPNLVLLALALGHRDLVGAYLLIPLAIVGMAMTFLVYRKNCRRIASLVDHSQENEVRMELLREDSDRIELARSQFLTILAQDIETPVASILSACEEFDEPHLDALAKLQNVATIRSKANDCLAYLAQLNEVSAGLLGDEPSVQHVVSFHAMVEGVRDAFRPMAMTRELSIVLNWAPSMPESIVVDGPKVRYLIYHLLNNAIHANRGKSIVLEVDRCEDAGEALLLFGVREESESNYVSMLRELATDPNLEMARESGDRQEVVSLPHRRTGRLARESGPIYIYRQMRAVAQSLGAKIRVSRMVNQGTLVRLELPIKRAEGQRAGVASPGTYVESSRALELASDLNAAAIVRGEGGDGRAKASARFVPQAKGHGNFGLNLTRKALIVDPNPVHRMAARKLLESRAFFVEEAESGVQAIRLCTEWRYDLVLLDIEQTESECLALARSIRGMASRCAQAAIVGLFEFPPSEDVRAAAMASFNALLQQPLQREALDATLSEYFSLRASLLPSPNHRLAASVGEDSATT
jgi:two-component system sensor histidine kinase TorS